MNGSPLGRRLAAPVFLFVGLAAFFPRTLSSGWSVLQGISIDPRHLNFVLEYAHQCLNASDRCRGLWNAPFFFPAANVTALTEPLLGSLPLYSPWRWLGAEPSLAFAIFEVAAIVVTFLAAHLFFRRALALSPVAAALAAYLFAFGNPRGAQMGHPHYFDAAPLVLLAAALVVVLRGGGAGPRRWILAAGGAFVWLFYSTVHLAAWTAILALLALPWILAQRATRAATRATIAARPLAWTAALLGAAALLAPTLVHFAAWSGRAGSAGWREVADLAPQPESWINPGRLNRVWGAVAEWPPIAGLGHGWEHELGLGLFTPILALAGLWTRRRDPWVRAVVGSSVVAVLLVTRWPGGFSLWQWVLAAMPALGTLRAPGRLVLVFLLPAAYGVGLAWQALRARRLALLAAAVLVVVPLEQLRRDNGYPRRALDRQSARLAAIVPRDCDAFFFSPIDLAAPSPAATQEIAMWAALAANVPTMNGYTSYPPPGWNLMEHAIATPADRERLGAALDAWMATADFHGELCWISTPIPRDRPLAPVVERRRR